MAFDESLTGGTTSKIVEVMVRDSTTGAGKTGLAFGDVTASYCREGSTRTAITLASGTAGDAYSSGKWCEVDATNQKGLYQLHVPDAAIAVGVAASTISLQATGMIDKAMRLKLETPVDVISISSSTTAANNAESCFTGTITTLDALDTAQDTQHAATLTRLGTPADTDVSTDIANAASQIGNLDTQLGDIPTVSEFEARTILAAAYFDASTDSVDLNADQSGVTIGTVTTNSDMRGTDSANTTAPDNASIAAILTDTGTTIPATLGVPTDTDLATDIANIDAGTAPTAAAVADAVWDEAMSGHTTAGTFGKLFDGITNLAAWLGLGLGKTADASTLAEVNATTAGAGYDNTSDSQQAIVDRGSTGPWTSGSVTGDAIITPLSASEVSRTNGTDITYFVGEAIATTIAITDSSGAAVDLSSKTLRIIIDRGGSGHSDVQVIASGSITVAGASSNQITFTNSAAVTNKAGSLRWALRDTDDGDRVLARGNVRVIETAEEDG